MQLNLLTQTTAVRRFAAAAQSGVQNVLDFTVGSIYLALANAVTAVALWLQWLILLVLATTRASTSNGTDLDTWMADWTVLRLPAAAATGQVTLSRYSATQPALILPGVQVKTTDGTQTFTVTTDTGNSSWQPTSSGYYVAAGVSSVTVPVQALAAGSAGNIQAGTLTLLATGVSGIDYASNATAYANGINAETDDALRARFVLFIGGLASGTTAAIGAAVGGVQQGLTYDVVTSSPGIGSTTLYIDDGSGAPDAGLLNTIYAAVNAVVVADVTLYVLPVIAVAAAVNISLVVTAGYQRPIVEAAVASAVAAYGLTLGFRQTLSYTRLAQVILDASPGLSDISALTINGVSASVTAGAGQRIEITATVS